MEDYNVTVHDAASETLSTAVVILLVIFFPIGVIVFIVRSISKAKTAHEDRKRTRAEVEAIKTDTSINKSVVLERYYELYEKGIITQAEFEDRKRLVLKKNGIMKM